MSDTDRNSGIEAISDDELEAVAGGASFQPEDKEQLIQATLDAKADGRAYRLANDNLSSAFCPCHFTYKWARINKVIKNGVTIVNLKGYTDVKCYQCGKTNTGCIY